MENTIKLYFNTNKKNIVVINIPNAKTSSDINDINKSMDEILQSNAFENKNGTLTNKYKAILVTTEKIKFNI